MVTFPAPALRTGRAVFPQPALQWDHASRTRSTLASTGRRVIAICDIPRKLHGFRSALRFASGLSSSLFTP